MMDFLIELVMELIMEGSLELSQNRKLPKWLRYPLIALVTLFFGAVIGLIFLVGFLVLKQTVLGGLAILAIGTVMLILAVRKFRKLYIEKKMEP